MDVQLEGEAGDMGQAAAKDLCGTQEHSSEPTLDGTKGDHTECSSQEATSADVMDQGSYDFTLVGGVYLNEDPHLLPHSASKCTQAPETPTCENSAPIFKDGITLSKASVNGAQPVCSPPTFTAGHPRWSSPQSSRNNGQGQHLPPTSTANSQHSLKTTAAQIQQVAGDDCCVHCVLACLFCELLSLCSVLMQCLACGQGCETLCCCGGGATGGVACGENSCTAALDCGMLEDCCESSDCLEICLECCSICFPA
ncbi:myoD family inhibitor-like [Scleropages formosus]|uniref:MyoD family inhibitor-like n=1 Tax=Scleropages formosus TaxID=113540 RepID=A0A0P7U9L7_SCLFO|nr:myoD family inhibitor-like [Scleropages formosus]